MNLWQKLKGSSARPGLASNRQRTFAAGETVAEPVLVMRPGAISSGNAGGLDPVVQPTEVVRAPAVPVLKLAVNNATPLTPAPNQDFDISASEQVSSGQSILCAIAELHATFPVWQGEWMSGVVAMELASVLRVMWLGLGDVALLGSADALGHSHATTVRNTLITDLHLSLVDEREVSAALLVELANYSPSRSSRARNLAGGTISRENYELVIHDELIAAAVKGRASDIHFIAQKAPDDGAIVALRMYGKYTPWRKGMSATLVRGCLGSAFGQRLSSKSNSKGHLHFDTEISFMTEQTVDGATWMGRCNGRAAVGHFKLVIRLLESNPQLESIPTLPELGYVPSLCEILDAAVRRNYGIIFIFGSTGSGKSTTLRTFMTRLNDPSNSAVYSVESPVEYLMPGCTQFPIPVDVNMSSEDMEAKFSAALKDVVRMDPDVVMVGEIRDHEGAKLTTELTTSGHRCYTTSHGDSAVDGLSRMCGEVIRMPSELFAGARFLSASIYQRLLPKLCKHCNVSAADPIHGLPQSKLDLLRTKFKLDPSTMRAANRSGCAHCQPEVPGLSSNGTKGVTVAAEVLVPTARMRELASRRDWSALMSTWRETRRCGFGEGDMTGKTAFECALYLAAQGVVAIADIEREFEPLETYEIYPMAGDGAIGEGCRQ